MVVGPLSKKGGLLNCRVLEFLRGKYVLAIKYALLAA
jgi:hypothetical protein